MPRILGQCSTIDLRRVVEAVKANADPLPSELYKSKGRIALAFVILTMEAGMGIDDMADILEVKLWDNNTFQIRVKPDLSQDKRLRWRVALAHPVDIGPVLRKLQK